jgi:diguanylate cyclase (GGDEF)-like protein
LDSATEAINLGASSYLLKPVSMPTLNTHVEKALANRNFYLKSQLLMNSYLDGTRNEREHLANITHIHEMFRKLIFSLKISDIMKILLNDLNNKLESYLCLAGINIFGSAEIFAMPFSSKITNKIIQEIICKYWNPLFGIIEKEKLSTEKTILNIFKSRTIQAVTTQSLKPITVPLICMGETKGSLSVFINSDLRLSEEKTQYLHVLSSLVSPLIENAYIHRQTKNLAATDSLTGVANHRTFHEMLSREIARANRDKTEFGLIILDIDDFKQINDTYGHQIGDAILQDLCNRIMFTIREEDLLSRYGGEEFIVIVTNSQTKGTFALADRIRLAIAQLPAVIKDLSINYTISVGISMYSGKAPRKKESLIKDADEALYSSKNQGKNRVSLR